jgi:RNA polymerase sigma-70 factor (ECF subfamily)
MTDFAADGHSLRVTSLATVAESDFSARGPATSRVGSTPDFDRLYDDHFEFVWRNLRRLGVPMSSLDDATQDVFVVALRRLSDFAHRSSSKTWLAGIAIRVAANYRRRLRRKGGLEPLTEAIQDCRPGPEIHLAQFEALRQLEAILATLDDDKREVFVLAELEGMTAPEIAEVANTNLNTVYSRLRAARIAFDESLQRLERGGR